MEEKATRRYRSKETYSEEIKKLTQDTRKAKLKGSAELYKLLSLASAIKQANFLEEEARKDEDDEDEDEANRLKTFKIVIVWKAHPAAYDQSSCYVFDRIEWNELATPWLRIARRSELSPIETLKRYGSAFFCEQRYYKST